MTEFKAKHFPTLVSFINAEPTWTLVSVIDPVWNETLPTSYILNREGEVVKKVQGKTDRVLREQLAEAVYNPAQLLAPSADEVTHVKAQMVFTNEAMK